MFEKNGRDPSCNFAGDIVALIYDELEGAQKARFESHLANCKMCAAELAGLSDARSSVAFWRAEEFDALPTPRIAIPFDEEMALAAVTGGRGTILTGFKKLFAFSPWAPAGISFAALAVTIGLAFVVFTYMNGSGTDLVGNKNTHPDVPQTGNSAPVTPAPHMAIASENTQAPEQKQATGPDAPVKASVKGVAADRRQKKAMAENIPDTAPKTTNKTNVPQTPKAPSLNNYAEVEDTTLRLADLFEEIDTKE